MNIVVAAANTSKYGILKGSVTHIDKEKLLNKRSKEMPLYKLAISLDTAVLKNKDETIQATKSMFVEVRIEYDKETYLNWLLERLNFKN